VYDRAGALIGRKTVPGFVQRMAFVDTRQLLVELFDPVLGELQVHALDVYDSSLRRLSERGSSAYFVQTPGGEVRIENVRAATNSALLFHALRRVRDSQTSTAFKDANNFAGRLSWNTANWLVGLGLLFEITGLEMVLLQAEEVARAVLDGANGRRGDLGPGVPPFLWATKKYSLDLATPLNLMVNDAMVLHALLYASRKLPLERTLKAEIIRHAELAYQYFEPYYRTEESGYRIPYGIAYWADGVWAPNNWQTQFGSVLILLYELTGRSTYLERARAIARRLKGEMTETTDGRLLWHYWPLAYYRGWSAADGVSTHHPSQNAAVDTLFEDVSHAGINLDFILLCHSIFDGEIFTDRDIDLVRATAVRATNAPGIARFISGDTSYQPANYRFLPVSGGWPKLHLTSLREFYARTIPLVYPSFDSLGGLLAYLSSIEPDDIGTGPGATIVTQRYGVGLSLISREAAILTDRDALGFLGFTSPMGR